MILLNGLAFRTLDNLFVLVNWTPFPVASCCFGAPKKLVSVPNRCSIGVLVVSWCILLLDGTIMGLTAGTGLGRLTRGLATVPCRLHGNVPKLLTTRRTELGARLELKLVLVLVIRFPVTLKPVGPSTVIRTRGFSA